MKKLFTLLLLFISIQMIAKKPDSRYYELRVYYCHPGRLDALIQRFTNHTTKIFEKHGMTNVGYWIPNNNEKNALYYILSYPNQVERDSSWKRFGRDPEWREVARKSEESGKIVAKVESTFMMATDFSPKIKPSHKSVDRAIELRTYTATPNHIDDILARFRNHTTKLFKKHGMTNIAYFKTIDKDPSVQPRLVYLLAHDSEAAGKASFDEFRKDPNWIKARDESEKNGKIVDKVESIYMHPTTFSTIR
ncbi:NIPSNAP family protein [Aquirufa ecclesiirivi]|uniref:NIPSNAP family protein n=1 Tax=Aquirufa ecclesiirivi TaxID=2715124 RepID=UPI0022A8B7C6|nr:NIPSNAP family protein [Aquirufa ecclesiirivi]MCZ2472729.1 NIPSNAP family protein [Aquirufa ecclesiirivi]